MLDNMMNKGRYSYEGLDRIIHEKARLGIMTSLMVNKGGLLFNELKALCDLTDGNLSRHIQLLQEEGLVEVWKGFKNKKPQTLCRITTLGRDKFLHYLNELEKVVQDASTELKNESKSKLEESGEGWVAV